MSSVHVRVLRDAYPEIYAGQERALGSVWRFLKDVRDYDLVLVPVERGFLVGEVHSTAWV